MRKASDEWFDANPWDEDRAFTGPGKYTFKSSYPKTEKASWIHDGSFADEENAYTVYNKADAYWTRDVDERDPIGRAGQTFFNLKMLASSAMGGLFDSHEPEPTEMPYKGYTRSKSAGVRSRQYRKNARRGRRDARRAQSGPATWKHMRQCVERKFHDVPQAVTNIDTSASPLITSVVAGVVQGTTAQTRIGTKLFAWDVAVRGEIKYSPVSLRNSDVIRVMLVVDKQSNGDNLLLSEVLDLGAGNDTFAFRNIENMKRFTILGDKTIHMNINGGSYTGAAAGNVEKTIPFGFYKKWASGLKVMYKTGNSDGSNGGIVDNNVWVIVFSRESAICTVQYETRMRYTD